MPNVLDSNGLQIKTVSEITSSITVALQALYGNDINVDPNSPDGQLINIFGQAAVDNLEFIASVYNDFNIDNARGIGLSSLVPINGLARNAGTYTVTPVSVTATQALTLKGLDGNVTPAGTEFMVADGNGNQFILVTSYSFVAAGIQSLSFRAVKIGQVQTVLNTITNIVTITQGITTVNNPSAATVTGVNEETDQDLKIRHARSFYLAAAGVALSIVPALLQEVPGVLDAYIEENPTGSALADGLAAHSIWAIVDGGTDAAVAAMIYKKRSGGCGMKGSTSVVVSRPNSQNITISFDRPTNQSLYVKFGLSAKNGSDTFDNTAIKAALVSALPYKIAQQATIGDVVAAMQSITPNGYLTAVKVSTDGVNWFDVVQTTDVQHRFSLTSGNITIS